MAGIRRLLLLGSVAAATACHDSTAPSVKPDLPSQASVYACTSGLVFGCGVVIKVYAQGTISTARLDALKSAAKTWNSAVLKKHPQVNLPYFDTTIVNAQSPGGNSVQVTFHGDQALTSYCGTGVPNVVDIYALSSTDPCPGNDTARVVTDLAAVAVHELGHAIGLRHVKRTAQTIPFVGECVMYVTATTPLNPSPCAYEEQFIYYAYGLRSSPTDSSSFIESVSLSPPGVTLTGGDTQEFTANAAVGVHWSTSNGNAGSLSSYTANPTTFQAANVSTTQSTQLTVELNDLPNVIWPAPTASANITVQASAPIVTSVVVNPGSTNVLVNGSANFSATAYSGSTSLPNEPLTWSVTGPAAISSSTGNSATVVGTAAGTATVTARASNGVEGSATLTITSPPPDASFSVTGSWKSPYYFEFYASGTADTYSWTYGDGSGYSSPYNFVSHTYSRCGIYTVTLTVTRSGQSASSSQQVSACDL